VKLVSKCLWACHVRKSLDIPWKSLADSFSNTPVLLTELCTDLRWTISLFPYHFSKSDVGRPFSESTFFDYDDRESTTVENEPFLQLQTQHLQEPPKSYLILLAFKLDPVQLLSRIYNLVSILIQIPHLEGHCLHLYWCKSVESFYVLYGALPPFFPA